MIKDLINATYDFLRNRLHSAYTNNKVETIECNLKKMAKLSVYISSHTIENNLKYLFPFNVSKGIRIYDNLYEDIIIILR